MALKTFVFISTVNNLSDARYCAGMHVDLIGFNVEKDNSKYINPETFKELTEWLSGVEFVAEFEDSDLEQISETLQSYEVNHVMVNDAKLIEPLQTKGLKVILKTDINNSLDSINPDLLVLTSSSDQMTADKEAIIKNVSVNHDILIGFGLDDKNVELVLEQTKAKGIALTGSDEIKPGYKDYDELADILETLEIDDLV